MSISVAFKQEEDIVVTLKKFPLSHKFLPGDPYVIGDEYVITSMLGNIKLNANAYVKVKRKRDGYEEVLSYSYFMDQKVKKNG